MKQKLYLLLLLAVMLAGYGESSKPHVEYTLDFFAKAVNAVLDKEHTGAIVLVGHSLGTPVCRQVLMSGRQGDLVDIDGVYCFYDGTETAVVVSASFAWSGNGHLYTEQRSLS